MYYATIDCGTTNSRAYIVDSTGKIHGKATKAVGVRDTAISGSKQSLRDGLREIVAAAAAQANVTVPELGAVFSSGMITSEIGLLELPHLMAPVGIDALADALTPVPDAGIIDADVPVYFVRGIKNKMDADCGRAPSAQVGELDFMRGEEAQTAGILSRPDTKLPVVVVILSSHTKFIPVDETGKILGSLTTMSGQIYDAVKNHTFIGKSVTQGEEGSKEPLGYFDTAVVDNAVSWINDVGLVRSLMFPRFLDVLLDTEWYERHLFFEALISAEDMLSIGQLGMLGVDAPANFVLVGREDRCRLYSYILGRQFPHSVIQTITDGEETDELSIQGVLSIARKAGVVK